MSTFAEAYQSGLAAAQEAQASIKEINEVFDEFDEAVKAISKGRIVINRIKKTDISPGLRLAADKAEQVKETREILYGKDVAPEAQFAIPYLIFAINAETKVEMPIAEYRMDKRGYPIRVKWSNQENSCWDRVALTETLKEVLADPATGRIFLGLLGRISGN